MGNKGGPCCRERTDEDGRINYTLLFFDIHPNKSCFFSQEKNTMFPVSRLPKKYHLKEEWVIAGSFFL
jgi:hypothetical protein